MEGEHCLGGNHGNQASTNHPAPLKEFSGILTTTHTYLSRGGGSGSKNQQISQAVNSNDQQSKVKQS